MLPHPVVTQMRRTLRLLICVGSAWMAGGCQTLLNKTDQEVYTAIRQRQVEALQLPAEARIDPPDASIRPDRSAYAFVPSRLSPQVPAEFQQPASTQPSRQTAEPGRSSAERTATTAPATQPAESDASQPSAAGRQEPAPVEGAEPLVFTLSDCLRYAFRYSRDFQSAKEDLYLQALSLTLERYLWTPRWVAKVEAQLSGEGQTGDWDRAMEAVAEVAVRQRLPFGGELTARIIDTLVRDIGEGVTTGESGQLILEATLPLLRGAGPVNYESRYQAERDLVYAVRDFERFRRRFAVQVASQYFNLLELKQRIVNAQKSADSNHDTYLRAKALFDAGRKIILDVQRAEQEELIARNDVIDATERYELALDGFKILLGMPTTQPLELKEQQIPLPVPQVSEQRAIEVAMQTRLDLLNAKDGIADAIRRVMVARNDLLPDLNLTAQVIFDTNPEKLKLWGFEAGLNTWTGTATLELPVDKKAELNEYRRRLIQLRRARRAYELAVDNVRLEVRRAMRRIEQAMFSLEIQKMNVELAERRKAYAQLMFQQGAFSNRDVVEATNELLRARNRYAAAQANLRVAILEFRRDTGTLRVDEEGNLLVWDTTQPRQEARMKR